jgi:hypothetical protein
MSKASIKNLVGIEIDEDYPWKDTLFINSGVATVEQSDYEKCRATISIKKCNQIDTNDCRDIGNNIFIGSNAFVDIKYGVRLERKESHRITLKVTQECNEWLIISLQLLLLEMNCTLIHAAALEKNGEVILLPSWGGVGKTATVMNMVCEDGWLLLGDDLVILQANEILPFLKPFVIYPYHKTLFPEIFIENKWRIVTNIKLNNFMSKIIPIAKKVMRPIPGLLAFSRKHDPQSMRISPMQIFRKEQLSVGGMLNKVIWLERITANQIGFGEKSAEALASKTTSVSMVELFADRLNCVFALCGSGIFDYRKIYLKMYELIYAAYKNTACFELDIPTSISIDRIGNVISKHIVSEKEIKK